MNDRDNEVRDYGRGVEARLFCLCLHSSYIHMAERIIYNLLYLYRIFMLIIIFSFCIVCYIHPHPALITLSSPLDPFDSTPHDPLICVAQSAVTIRIQKCPIWVNYLSAINITLYNMVTFV